MAKQKSSSYDLALKKLLFSESPSVPCEVEYRAEVEWREGVPYLTKAPVRISANPTQALSDLLQKSLDLPYSGGNPALQGLSAGEAMIVSMVMQAANGDSDARTEVLDRVLGKPKQSIESVSLTGDLSEFLDKVAEATRVQTIDVNINPINQEDDL